MLTDNLLRVGGRVAHSLLPFDSKHQIILAKKHHLSELLIKDIHVRNCHSGRELTLNLLRERFWIIHAKSLIRKVLLNCSYCKRQRILPTPPLMSDLPAERVLVPTSPFIHTGIDYFGPLFVKFSRKTRSNQAISKRYGAIFTCLASRALHIELAGDLSTDSFILALRRFTARRGNPQTITSDNGTNFVGAQRELSDAIQKLDQHKIRDELSPERIQWKFNPPSSPWMGGCMVAMVKLTKRALKTIVKNRLFTEEALSTFLIEVESIINSRPLTPASDDIDDLEPITPNHLLLGRPSPNFQPCITNTEDINLRKRWRAVQAATDMFWRRWLKEYVPLLTERKKWNVKNRNFQIGDLVLIAETGVPRSTWPLARIIEVKTSSDGTVRVVKVKSHHGVYVRPAASLCLLEES